MKPSKAIALLAIPAAGYLAYQYFQARQSSAENLQARFQAVKIDLPASAKAAFLKIYYDVGIGITNPDRGAIKVNAVNIDIVLNGSNIGRIQKLDKFSVSPRTSADISVKGEINTLGVVDFIRNAIAKGIGSMQLYATGFIDTDLGRVHLNSEKIQF